MEGVMRRKCGETHLVREEGRSGGSLPVSRLEAILEPDRIHGLCQVRHTVLDGARASEDGNMDGVRMWGGMGRCQSVGKKDEGREGEGNH